jgi:hypothetical protein
VFGELCDLGLHTWKFIHCVHSVFCLEPEYTCFETTLVSCKRLNHFGGGGLFCSRNCSMIPWKNLIVFGGYLKWRLSRTVGSTVADSLKCLTTDCTADQSHFDSQQGQNIFVPTISRLAVEIRPKDTVSSLPGSKAAVVVKPTHFHLMPKLRMRGAIPSLPHLPSWRVQDNCNVFTLLYQGSKSLFISFAIWDVTYSRPSWWTWCHVDWRFVTEVLETLFPASLV